MASVHDFRSYQTARRYRDRPNVYQALVRRMVADEKAGKSPREALIEARQHEPLPVWWPTPPEAC